MARPNYFLPSARNVSSSARAKVVALCFLILIGIFQWLPNGLVFLGRVIRAPLPKDDTGMTRILQARIADLEAERDTLQQLSRAGMADNVLLAPVQLGPGFVLSDSLLLSAGQKQGVRQGDVVIVPGGIAIGVIAEAQENWSKAALFSRLGSIIMLRGGTAKEIVFEGWGVGGGGLRVELPSTVGLGVGDPVWLGSNPTYIAGLVDASDRAPGRQLQQLTIRIPISAERMRHVFIVRSEPR